MLIQSWIDVTTVALQDLWQSFILFVPSVIGALLLVLVGWIIAFGLERLTVRIVNFIRINQLLEKIGIGKVVSRANLKLDAGQFCGFIVKWFIILAFLMAATDVLRLDAVTFFLRSVLGYVPSILGAVLILLITVWAANFLQRLVEASVAATAIKDTGLMSVVTKWAVLVFGLLAALNQLGIAPMLIQSLVTGLIAMLAIAGGLAFGLGGKDHASAFIEKLKRELGA